MPAKRKTQFTVEALVVQGDGIPDGDLVTKYVNGKVKERLFIPFSKMKVTLKQRARSDTPDEKTKGKQEKIVYVNIPDNLGDTDKRVVVQGRSKLGQYIKQGGFEEIGAMMVTGLLKVLMMLFL